MTIRVVIVEDQTIVRQGLRSLLGLSGDIEIAGEAFDGDTNLFDAVRAGAKGWLLKDVSLERLTSAIRTLAEGGTCIEPVITERIVRALGESNVAFDSAELPEPLTDREKTILRLLAGGYSNREISELLNISDGTVKNHISNLLAKLGVRDRTRAVLKAIDLGVI